MNLVPPDVTEELTPLLSNLMLNDNEIRSQAEKTMDNRLAQSPGTYLVALAQFSVSADSDVIRSFALVLLRRFMLRPVSDQPRPTTNAKGRPQTLSDQMTPAISGAIEDLLLHSFMHESSPSVRSASVETITALATNMRRKGRPWLALQPQAFGMTQNGNTAMRESAFRLLAGTRMLGVCGQTDSVMKVLNGGLEDESLDVRFYALRAGVSFLSHSDEHQLVQAYPILSQMLNSLPSLPPSRLPKFLSTLSKLAVSKPTLFEPHLQSLLDFLGPLIPPTIDESSTPTESKPAFIFPPPSDVPKSPKDDGDKLDEDKLDEEKEAMMKAVLEFMITLSEAKLGIFMSVHEWTAAVVRGCLEGMETLRDNQLEEWLESDPADDNTDNSYARACEQSLHRLAMASEKNPVLSHTFEHLPGMLASYNWRLRRAGLAAIAQVVVPWSFTIMQDDLSKLVKMVVPLFKDSHPRVRYAACQAVGQLCSDVHHSAQKKFGRELFVVLISTLEAPEKRVRSQAAATLIDLCDGVQQAEIMPYLDPIVERLLEPLNPTEDNAKQTNTYVQEQAIAALAVVAKKSPGVFAKHYSSVMPLLLNILRNANRSDSGKLIAKTMECTGLITAAVGLDVFRPDAATLAELLVQIQNGADEGDTVLHQTLNPTWAIICRTMGAEFEPYLSAVIPPLIGVLAANNFSEPASWHLLSLFTKKGGIPSSKMDAKREAFQSLAVYCSTMQAGFAPYISQSLELTLSALRLNLFYGIRDVCTPLVPALLSCAKASNTLTTEMISSSFFELVNCIGSETESTYLTSHLEFFTSSLKVVGGPPVLPPELCNGLVESMKRQLDRIADRRKNGRPQPDMAFGFDFGAMDDEMEAFALKRMHKLLHYLDSNHPLLASVSSMMVMGPCQSGLTYKIQSALARLDSIMGL